MSGLRIVRAWNRALNCGIASIPKSFKMRFCELFFVGPSHATFLAQAFVFWLWAFGCLQQVDNNRDDSTRELVVLQQIVFIQDVHNRKPGWFSGILYIQLPNFLLHWCFFFRLFVCFHCFCCRCHKFVLWMCTWNVENRNSGPRHRAAPRRPYSTRTAAATRCNVDRWSHDRLQLTRSA